MLKILELAILVGAVLIIFLPATCSSKTWLIASKLSVSRSTRRIKSSAVNLARRANENHHDTSQVYAHAYAAYIFRWVNKIIYWSQWTKWQSKTLKSWICELKWLNKQVLAKKTLHPQDWLWCGAIQRYLKGPMALPKCPFSCQRVHFWLKSHKLYDIYGI